MFILFMKVQPFAGIIDSVKWGVPRVLFNMHAVGPFKYQRRAQDFISPGNSVSLEFRVILLLNYTSASDTVETFFVAANFCSYFWLSLMRCTCNIAWIRVFVH